MSELRFMSPEHVAAMNAILAKDEASQHACAQLECDLMLAYELRDGQNTVWWTMSFSRADGVRFGLDAPTKTPDLSLQGDYRAMLDATRRTKAGEKVEMPLTSVGDATVMERIGPAFAAAQAVATLEAEIPAD